MRRTIRKLPVVLAVFLLAAPLAAAAQQPAKAYRIGMLEMIATSLNTANLQAFRQELTALGYVECQNLAIDYRSADGTAERFPGLAADPGSSAG